MLEIQKIKVKLGFNFARILCASCAFNNTFVFLADKFETTRAPINSFLNESKFGPVLVHTNSQGAPIFQQRYPRTVYTFAMMTDQEVIVPNPPEQRLEIIDLNTHQIRHVQHYFNYFQPLKMTHDLYSIHTFSETLLVVIIHRNSEKTRSFLTYYQHQDLKGRAKPVVQWMVDRPTQFYKLYKMNDHSKIGYQITDKHKRTIVYFDLKANPNKQEKNVVIRPKKRYHVGSIEETICFLWELKPDVYLCIGGYSYHSFRPENEHGFINDNYIVNATKSQLNPYVEQTQFMLQSQCQQKWYKDKFYQAFRLGNFSVFEIRLNDTFKNLTPDKILKFVHNESQQIVCTHEISFDESDTGTFFLPGWDNRTVVFPQDDHANPNMAVLTVLKVVSYFGAKETFMYFLLHLNQDFDDDLLQDAIELMTNQLT